MSHAVGKIAGHALEGASERARPAWSTSHRPAEAPSHPRIVQSSSRVDPGAQSHPQPQTGVGGPGPEAQHSPQKVPRPSQPAGPSSALDCSHTDFQSPVPSRPRQRCLHTDTPVLCEGTATRRAPGRHATAGQGGASPGASGVAGAPCGVDVRRQAHATPSRENLFPENL